ncbi:MAG TPA: radical SAM family heme chaperone HemW [Pirellulales bacterium]|jgi:oxygen-independent coproporphyrinogen-3 oxidase|nr:radical SAM family heme chaperone HemW [Pirellulales bacterium]
MARVTTIVPFSRLLPSDPPRAAYIHVPFCAHRCGYCNFTLVASRDDLIDGYLEAIAAELGWLGRPRPVDTLFFGGGTPTQLPPDRLAQLIATARHWFPLSDGYELSIEANPADVTDERLAQLAELGVTRISLGGQSFDQAKLSRLERDHTPEQLSVAVSIAKRWMRSVSVDLIFGVPDESLAVWQRDLETLLALEPDHVSTYGLTFERGTAFWSRLQHGRLARLDEDLEGAMYAAAIDTLAAAGLEHYEVSNFARPGHRCRHNEIYWAGGGYYAAGPGAARFVDGRRELNHRSTTTWLRRVLAGQSPVAESEVLLPADRARELLVFGLRRLAGVERRSFGDVTGFEIDQLVGRELAELAHLGLMQVEPDGARLTRAGLFVSDAIWPRLLRPDPVRDAVATSAARGGSH